MRIQVEERYALNSQGKSVPIQEVGWAAEGELPTHIVLQFTSSHGGAISAHRAIRCGLIM